MLAGRRQREMIDYRNAFLGHASFALAFAVILASCSGVRPLLSSTGSVSTFTGAAASKLLA